jgi:hypothetical protein
MEKKKYKRADFEVEAVQYQLGQGLEDGFESWTKVVTNGWIVSEGLIQVEREGRVLCPFIHSRRGITFIKEGDYIIFESNGERHCCGGDKFQERYLPIDD